MNEKPVCMSFKRIFSCAFSCLALLTGAVALRDVRLSVPAAIVRGQTAVLQCHYNLEGAALYSLKWYKGRREFFRFTPRENPPIKVFPISGVSVDRSRSNATHLTLLRAGAALSGRYSCEVSADAPSFHTNLVSAELAVVDVPSDSPSITGVKPRYRTGDTLMANCSSSWSRPAATLLWVVNEVQAPASQLEHYPVVRDPTNGRERSSLGLNLPLLTPGRFKVRCVASIEPVYFKSAETSVEATEKPPPSLQLAPPPPPPTRLSWGLLDDVVEEYKHKETSVASGSLEPMARQYVLSLTILVSAATVLGS